MLKRISAYLVLLLAFTGLTACTGGGNDMASLRAYVDVQMNLSGGEVEPLPEFVAHEPFTYSAAGLRGPFDIPVDIASALANQASAEVRPDENRVKQYLEGFSIASLRMVGSMSGNGNLWALVQDENAEIHEVMVGDYLGRNHGRIVSASDSKLEVIEIVPSGDGWIERPQTIMLINLEE